MPYWSILQEQQDFYLLLSSLAKQQKLCCFARNNEGTVAWSSSPYHAFCQASLLYALSNPWSHYQLHSLSSFIFWACLTLLSFTMEDFVTTLGSDTISKVFVSLVRILHRPTNTFFPKAFSPHFCQAQPVGVSKWLYSVSITAGKLKLAL